MNTLLKVALRQQTIYVPEAAIVSSEKKLMPHTGLLAANLSKLGFGVTEPLLRILNRTGIPFQKEVLHTVQEVMGVKKNWTPLVKGWDVPTNESITDHIITFFTNVFQGKGTTLPCGHIIPANTFPLERYNGCPFCGTPFELYKLELRNQGSKLKMLSLWNDADAIQYFTDLLLSKTALDATQIDSLKILLAQLPLPEVSIGMKETLMAVINAFVSNGQPDKAQSLFTSPTDIMRYLWYKQTGFLQIIEPKTIMKRQVKNNRHLHPVLDKSAAAKVLSKATLKLKYNRTQCAMVAAWLNHLPQDAEKICEMMHPKRSMWVRFIRALRLAEYSKKKGFEKLKEVLDLFYNQLYEVWQGRVDFYRLRMDAENTFGMLKQRPGLFARSLFSNMLWFGADDTVKAFAEVANKVPARLLFTLNMYAANYFNKNAERSVKPLGGVNKRVPANALVQMYDEKALDAMQSSVAGLCLDVMKQRFVALPETAAASMYIDPALYKMPVSIGDRSDNVQDLPAALMGSRFAVEGDAVRLFMQWGMGLPAQHLDMDLSCQVVYAYKTERCSFSQLTATGCKHSGDIQRIPHNVGAAEYIELDLWTLQKSGALYVVFTCNAYSNGSITPNLVVGWMNSRNKMHISASGVAYDPSCVQQQVRITKGLTKGLVFGVLDVQAAEIIWLELPFDGQLVQNLDVQNIKAMLAKLNCKLSIGQLLQVKAEAQGMYLASTADADEIYTADWGRNAAAVTQLLVD